MRRGRWLLLLCGACGRIGFDAPGSAIGGDGGGTGDGGIVIDNGDGSIIVPAGTNFAFVTSDATAPAALGGIAGADTHCNDLARAAGLPGTYVAWLSDASTNAVDRLAGSRGWVRSDGRPFVDTVADLLAGRIVYPLALDENRSPTPAPSIATGTQADGLASGLDCSGFTMTGALVLGYSARTTNDWTAGDADLMFACDTPLPTYCFGIGGTTPVSIPAPPPHRTAFLSTGTFTANAGRATADTMCQTEATNAGLNGSYLALLAMNTSSALSRFSMTGPPWVRVDGALLTASWSDVSMGALVTPLNVTTGGAYLGPIAVRFGSTSPGQTANNDTLTCADWTDATNSFAGASGFANASDGTAFFGPLTSCQTPQRVYCFEQ